MTSSIDSTLVSNEIDSVLKASRLSFAPKVLHWNSHERWYEEDFVKGCPFYPHPRAETDIFLKIFHQNIIPCLEKMILLQPPQIVEIQEYVSRLQSIVTVRKNTALKENSQCISSIIEFIDMMAALICHDSKDRIPLVFSHGDFSLVNILKTKSGIKVIDWEGASIRNPLYDFYNYFLTETYYKRTKRSLVQEINEAIKSLQSRLVTTAPEIASMMESFSDIYRRLYYLERLCMLLERDLTKKVLEVISRSIRVFKRCEENFAKY